MAMTDSRRHRARQQAVACAMLLGSALWGLGAEAEAAPRHAVHTIAIEGMQFSPGSIEVRAGDTVIWKNRDPFPHTATAEAKGFDSREITEGRSWKLVVAKRGRFSYFCTLHRTMKGTLIVK
jgi:plastocyanin